MNHVGSNIQNHKTKEKAPCQGKVPSKEPVFQKAPGNPVPPAQNQSSTMLQMISSLCWKVEKMEQKFQELLD